MRLREAIGRLDEWSEEETLYVEGPPSGWGPDRFTGIGIENVEAETESLPPEAEGKRYFLELSIAKELIAGIESHLGRPPMLDQKVERIIYYARFDA